MVGVAVRCPDGREVPLPSQEGDGKQPGHIEALQLSTDGVWAPNSSRQPAFRLWEVQVVGTSATQAKLQVVDCTSLAIVEEPGRVAGQYTPRGVADSTDPPITLCVGHRFYLSGARARGTFELLKHDTGGGAVGSGTAVANEAPSPDSPIVVEDDSDGGGSEAHGSEPSAVKRRRLSAERQGMLLADAPFGLLRVDSGHMEHEHNSGCLGVRLGDIVEAAGLRFAFVSNFMIDVPFLAGECPALINCPKVLLLHGFKMAADHQQAVSLGERLGWRVCQAEVLDRYGTHHTKAFILQYDAGLRVVIHTANLLYGDCHCKTQVVWWQDFPRKETAAARSSEFERSLVAYLGKLRGIPPSEHRQLVQICQEHDFSCARAQLLSSVPGGHTGDALHAHGHMQLRRLLSRERFHAKFRRSPVVAQFSSVGGTKGRWMEQLMDSFSAGRCADVQGAALGAAGELQVVWPTVQEVRDSVEGLAAGNSIPGTQDKVAPLRDLLHRWRGGAVGRDRAALHCKTYCRYAEGGDSIAWAVLTSSNLSKAAWGELQKNGTQLFCRSYELGVLLTPRLEASFRASAAPNFSCTANVHRPPRDGLRCLPLGRRPPDGTLACSPRGSWDALEFRAMAPQPTGARPGDPAATWLYLPIPYCLPPARYSISDTPWAIDGDYGPT